MSDFVIRDPFGNYLCPRCGCHLDKVEEPTGGNQFFCRGCKRILTPHFCVQGQTFGEVYRVRKEEQP